MDFGKSKFWTCWLATVFVYGLWNDWNINSMLYREFEYDESFFLKHKSKKIDIIWFIEFLLLTFKLHESP